MTDPEGAPLTTDGHLAGVLLFAAGAGITTGVTIGQWQEAVLWLIPLVAGAVILHRALRR